ncbi:MAG: GNAT family N-acetyltransferase [Betaproteobacteria bacterium]|nr:GNAT family N-acetyltransferase [Betaproteobacteria bacterium]
MNIHFTTAAQSGDFDAIAELGAVIWTEHYTPIVGKSQVAYMLEQFQSSRSIAFQVVEQRYVYTMAWADERLVGYAGVKPEADGSLLLSKFYILKEFRGCGMGRRIFERVTRPFVKPGGTKVWLTVNKKNAGAIAAYRKLGLAVERELVTDIGEGYVMDDYVMVLTLPD